MEKVYALILTRNIMKVEYRSYRELSCHVQKLEYLFFIRITNYEIELNSKFNYKTEIKTKPNSNYLEEKMDE